MADPVWIVDEHVLQNGGQTSAPVSAVVPAGTEPGLYVRVVSGGGGGGGGAVTIADGADVAEGSTTDVAWVAGAGTVISLLKKIASGGGGGSGPVTIADGADVAEGTTTDADTVNTVIGRLKKIVTLLSATLTVTGPLTDAQLRASAVPVSGPLTDTQLRASAVPVSGPLTDTQLRASAVPVSGTVTAVTGGLTDTQLRASAVPVSAASLPLPANAAQETGGNLAALAAAIRTDASPAPTQGALTDPVSRRLQELMLLTTNAALMAQMVVTEPGVPHYGFEVR